MKKMTKYTMLFALTFLIALPNVQAMDEEEKKNESPQAMDNHQPEKESVKSKINRLKNNRKVGIYSNQPNIVIDQQPIQQPIQLNVQPNIPKSLTKEGEDVRKTDISYPDSEEDN
jgi:hypothetical protein